MANRINQILTEVTKLRMFETTNQIVKFLRDEYGLASTVEATQPNEFIDIYLSDFKHADDVEVELPDDKITKAILKMFNEIHKDEGLQAVNVWPTEYGYVIVLDIPLSKEDSLTENYLQYYYYNNMTINVEEDDNKTNINMRSVLKEDREDEEALLKRLTKQDVSKTSQELEDSPKREPKQDLDTFEDEVEEVEEDFLDDLEIEEVKPSKPDVEKDASNTILDNRFIWLFTVLDDNADELTSEIENLDAAIDELVYNDNAAMIVAYPYIDPNPEDDNVDLVFADNPGPIIVYNEEDE